MAKATPEILVVFNPQAGSAHQTQIRRLVDRHFAGRRVELLESHIEGSMADQLAPWLEAGVHLIVAAGGDGTVSAVAAALVNTDVPLGILPLGTGNALCRELDIPLRHEQAAQLLAGPFEIRRLDVMRIGGAVYMLSVSVGLSATTMRDTAAKNKKRFGRAAYIWTGILKLFGLERRDYVVEVDRHMLNVRANEVLAVNSSIIGYKALRWGPHVLPDDGHLDLCFIRARSGLDYLRLVWRLLTRRKRHSPTLNCVIARQRIIIREPAGLPVQGDGDDIGETPIEIELVPSSLKVVVPRGKSKGG